LVRFFGKTTRARTPRKTKAELEAAAAAEKPPATPPPAQKPPGPPARASASTTAAEAEPEKKAPVRRRTTTTRPPRRDWAAEAAAAPIDAPAPRPTSLATSPSDEHDAGEPGETAIAKRRRGTRGGRGRKKPGATANGVDAGAAPPIAVKDLPVLRAAGPVTLEAAIAQQAHVLETFARDMKTTLTGLQSTISDLQEKIDRGGNGGSATAHPRVGIFVDVPNLIYAAERRNVTIDFGRVLNYFTRNRQLVRASAYAPITDDPQAKLESQRFVHHFVGHPYRVITKPLKRFADGSMKANFDIELAIDILTMSDRLDVVVLMSGDGDFRRLVELISSRGVRVEVVAFSETASSELKAVADLYVDIGTHLEEFRTQK